MTKHYLTKSNFKLGVECKQKLKYYKAKYPSSLQDYDMLEFFAEGGFMVEAIAHGVMLHANPAAEFEVTLKHDRYQARVDGLEQFATHAVLTEIKATSVESDDPAQFFTKNGDVNSSWRPYLLDITFQVMVARLVHPGLEIRPQLCVVNKTKRTSLEGIYKNIDIVDDKDADRNKPRAVFTGDRAALAADHFLEFIDVANVVDQLMGEVETSARDLLDFIDGNQPGYEPERPATLCRKCEFRGPSLAPNGFTECWGPSPTYSPHILDIHQGYRSKEQRAVYEAMRDAGNYRLVDLPDGVVDAGGSWGPNTPQSSGGGAHRQRVARCSTTQRDEGGHVSDPFHRLRSLPHSRAVLGGYEALRTGRVSVQLPHAGFARCHHAATCPVVEPARRVSQR